MSDLWMLTDRLGQSPYIEKISNISTATAINQVDGFIDIDDLQPTKDISSQQLENIKVYLNRNLNLKKQLISKERLSYQYCYTDRWYQFRYF